MVAICHQIKISISFIQLSEILLVKLTGTHITHFISSS